MDPNRTPCRIPVAIHESAQVPENAITGTLQHCIRLLLTSLLLAGIAVAPAFANECDDSCLPCHVNSDAVHGDYSHAAAPGSGPVTIFPDNGHDDAGWVGATPYFAVTVGCGTCHNNDLPAIHGNDCATCHPTPENTLGIWGKGCQQGGCHPFYHEDSTKAHEPFENAYNPANQCNSCHGPLGVTQSQCLNCHAAYGPGDVTPPVTTSNTQADYYGPASIAFSMTDNGKVAVGRTFYILDNGAVTAAGKYLLVTALGSHELEFWSMDQSGNTEAAHNNVFFTLSEDTTPPTTTSNAKASYNQGEVITLTATDTSTQGVKTTFYRLNDGSIQAGTTVVIPATSGLVAYTLTFWSEDWAGNIEPEKSVTFTVLGGTGTIRLVWGDSDVSGSPCPDDPGAKASWAIKRGTTTVISGAGSCPNWSGVNSVIVPLSLTPYGVDINWWDSESGYYDISTFPNVNITTPGQVIQFNY